MTSASQPTTASAIGPLKTTEEFAELAHVSVQTIYQWHQSGRGPRGFRVGRRVLYREVDIVEWLGGRRADGESRWT